MAGLLGNFAAKMLEKWAECKQPTAALPCLKPCDQLLQPVYCQFVILELWQARNSDHRDHTYAAHADRHCPALISKAFGGKAMFGQRFALFPVARANGQGRLLKNQGRGRLALHPTVMERARAR